MERADTQPNPNLLGRARTLVRRRSFVAGAGLLAAALLWQGYRGAPEEGSRAAAAETESDRAASDREAQSPIEEALESLDGAPLDLPRPAEARRLPDHLEAFYRHRSGEPAWFDRGWLGGRKPVAEVATLVSLAEEAETSGDIRSGSLGVERLKALLETLGRDPAPAELAEADVALTWTALHLVSQLALGPVLPEEAGIRWDVAMREVDLARVLDEALRENLDDLGARVEPDHSRYRRLREVRERYRSIVHEGGWPQVPEGKVLEIGEEGDPRRLRSLRLRLAAEGFLDEADPESESPVYSEDLARAVERFQATRTLERDGLLGPKTQEELNVPAERRLRQIELNLARWRWVPDDVWKDSIVVNIPGYHLWRYVDGEPVLDMGVVVGKPDWPTPVFSDAVEYLVLNPAWNVPVSIVRDEILPSYRKDPGYLEENDMVLLEGWGDEARAVSPRRLEELASGGAGDLHLQQRPGPTNPLGTIKFMFPNEHNVYLHDTAARALFDEADRDLSHGCVRVARPYELAANLMRDSGWTASDVQRLVRNREKSEVALPERVPVHLLYWTAEVRPDGVLHFYEDIYGIDRAQERELLS